MVYYGAFRKEGLSDYEVMKAAHDYANAHCEPVMAEYGRIYNLDLIPEPIYIQTPVDFNGATIIIDDSQLELHLAGPVFIVGKPNRNGTVFNYTEPILTTDTKINLTFDSPYLLEVEDLTQRNFIRFGDNGHAGTPRKELIIVQEDGTIKVPLNEDFTTPSRIKGYPIEKETLTIQNGTFITIANRGPQDYYYHWRGFSVLRSHTHFNNINYSIQDEGLTGSPYAGFIVASHIYDLQISNMNIQAHKTYYQWALPGEQSGTPMGTYVFKSMNQLMSN